MTSLMFLYNFIYNIKTDIPLFILSISFYQFSNFIKIINYINNKKLFKKLKLKYQLLT